MNERKKIGNRMKEAREYLGLSQQDVAIKLRLPRSAISQIENGQRGVETLELKALSRLYERPVTYFTGEEQAAVVPADVELLTRQVKRLSPEDRETLLRYAEFLVQKAASKDSDD
jgi:transcriptional regulator with XRE-family HTH domain